MVRGRGEGDYGRAAKIRERQKMDGAVVAGGGTDKALNSGCTVLASKGESQDK